MKKDREQVVYDVVRLHNLGQRNRAIARSVGIDPKTVKRILEKEESRRKKGESALEREGVRSPVPKGSKLDTFAEQIKAWLEEFPKLTATRVQEMLQDLGGAVGYSIVRAYVKEMRARKEPKVPVIKVVTPPGQQCQFDWSPYTIENGLIVQLWSCTLSWSRGRHFEATNNTRQTTILRMLQAAFDTWGGVPHQVVTDSMPGVVDRWELDEPVLNLRFVDFAAYYDFSVLISPRRTPRFKGKVERPFWYAELNFLGGRKFHSLQQFREGLEWWTREKAMKRPHPETKRPIREMLDEERPYLQSLSLRPYDTRDVAIRVVDAYGYAVYETNRYRLPDKYVGLKVHVCIGSDRIEFFDRGVHRIIEYDRIPDGAGLDTGHGKRKQRHDLGLLADRVAQWGCESAEFVRNLRVHHRCPGPHMAHLLHLQMEWSLDDIVAAIHHAIQYGAYNANAVERILNARFVPRKLLDQVADATRAQVKKAMDDHPVVQRGLDEYESLKMGDPMQSPEEDNNDNTTDSGTDGSADL